MNSEKKVKSLALKMMTNKCNLLFSNRGYKLDMRFTISRQIAAYIKDNPLSDSQKKEIIYKIRLRARNKPTGF